MYYALRRAERWSGLGFRDAHRDHVLEEESDMYSILRAFGKTILWCCPHAPAASTLCDAYSRVLCTARRRCVRPRDRSRRLLSRCMARVFCRSQIREEPEVSISANIISSQHTHRLMARKKRLTGHIHTQHYGTCMIRTPLINTTPNSADKTPDDGGGSGAKWHVL